MEFLRYIVIRDFSSNDPDSIRPFVVYKLEKIKIYTDVIDFRICRITSMKFLESGPIITFKY